MPHCVKETIMNIHPRMLELTINTDINAFSIMNTELFDAIAEEVDLETCTNQELREIFWIVRKQLTHLNWKEMVKYFVEHLPFGLNQTLIAWDGHEPCSGCPDAMLEDNGYCHHRGECKAWEIYEAK
jgi:hypothetical protein